MASKDQVNVFKDREGYNAVLSSLNDSLKRECKLREENERLKQEETSVDHAFAALLVKGQWRKTPFRSEEKALLKDGDMGIEYDGPIESVLTRDFGTLESTTRLYGQVWTGGPQAVIRYYDADPPGREKLPFCAVAVLSENQLRKLPGSKPGMAIIEFSNSAVTIVDSFR